jgi:hypothetical protein|tara:strand:+ start:2194 stop:2592 length:399 start_codon:yes stop_codon:yes gene_type:complete
MAQWTPSHHNNADEYIGSCLPFATGNLALTTAPTVIHFPYVTRWIQVFNTGAGVIRVGFTKNGVNGNPAANSNYFTLSGSNGTTQRLELKVTKIFLRADSGDGACSVVAGYTNVPKQQYLNLSGSSDFAGVG